MTPFVTFPWKWPQAYVDKGLSEVTNEVTKNVDTPRRHQVITRSTPKRYMKN
ncbi:hypothetical protein BJD51_gp76 [Salmonella phage BP12C]|uniref:Uncharacterized protein n=1 Tax=Salmonella phage BP12C TaxID=1543203 RepID=A0A140XG31_9CAUD|nr:hypothetical protein BJD51_gp76 [Salmonella phage BP12C]AIT13801.1 hypothetical protein BP12C_76 [Salmonella phage BP12C]